MIIDNIDNHLVWFIPDIVLYDLPGIERTPAATFTFWVQNHDNHDNTIMLYVAICVTIPSCCMILFLWPARIRTSLVHQSIAFFFFWCGCARLPFRSVPRFCGILTKTNTAFAQDNHHHSHHHHQHQQQQSPVGATCSWGSCACWGFLKVGLSSASKSPPSCQWCRDLLEFFLTIGNFSKYFVLWSFFLPLSPFSLKIQKSVWGRLCYLDHLRRKCCFCCLS